MRKSVCWTEMSEWQSIDWVFERDEDRAPVMPSRWNGLQQSLSVDGYFVCCSPRIVRYVQRIADAVAFRAKLNLWICFAGEPPHLTLPTLEYHEWHFISIFWPILDERSSAQQLTGYWMDLHREFYISFGMFIVSAHSRNSQVNTRIVWSNRSYCRMIFEMHFLLNFIYLQNTIITLIVSRWDGSCFLHFLIAFFASSSKYDTLALS